MRMITCRLSVLMDQWNAERALHTERLTQYLLCEKTGLSKVTINKLYHNKFTRTDNQTLEKLCDFFECEIGDLLKLQ